MADFDEGRSGRFCRNVSNEDVSNFNMRRGRPGIAIYRPGSGPLRKSGGNEDDFSGESSRTDRSQSNDTRDKHYNNSKNTSKDKCDINRISDDFDRMSVSSNSSRNDRKNYNRPNCSVNSSNNGNSEPRKRNKKPEIPIYIPKQLAQTFTERDKSKEVGRDRSESFRRDKKKWNDLENWDSDQYDGEQSFKSLSTDMESKFKNDFRRKRMSQKPLTSENKSENVNNAVLSNGNPLPLMDIKFDSSDIAKLRNCTKLEHLECEKDVLKPMHSENESGRDVRESHQQGNRSFRQASEPRSLPMTHLDSRSRDSRSMEPAGINAKPPPGQFRKGKPVIKQFNPVTINALPPRLKKKFLEENGIQESPISHTSYIGTNSEDVWDGSSITFQGTNTNVYYPNMPPPPIFNQPPPHMIYSHPPPSVWSQTLPPRSRGRGRLGLQELEIGRIVHEAARYTRSLTPDRLKEADSRSLDSIPASVENSRPNSRIERDIKNQDQTQYEDDNLEKYNMKQSVINQKEETPHLEQNLNNNRNRMVKKQHKETPYENNSERYTNRNQRVQKQHEALYIEDNSEGYRNQRMKKQHKETSYTEDNSERYTNTNQNLNKTQNTYQEEQKDSAQIVTNEVPKLVEPKTPEQPKSPKDTVSKSTPDILDWAEEVERSERLNNELKITEEASSTFTSDLPRTTSLNSLQGNPRHNRPKGRKTRRKRRAGKENSDRSLSRENLKHDNDRRRGSVEYNAQHSRNSSTERRNWREASTDSMADSSRPWRSQVHGSSRNSSTERWHSNVDHRETHYNPSDRRYRTNSRERSRRNSSNERLGYRNGSTERQGYRNYNHDRRGSRNSSSERPRDGKKPEENWRTELARLNSNASQQQEIKESHKPAGILVLPTAPPPSISPNNEQGQFQRQLFDPSNPNKPIIVPAGGTRSAPYPMHDYSQPPPDQFAVPRTPNHHSHNPKLLMDMERIEYEMVWILQSGTVFEYWPRITELRLMLETILRALLTSDIKFCEQENIEQHFWKLLYYNIIEYLRKGIQDHPEAKDQYRVLILGIVEEGMKYLQHTLELLEKVYKFKLDDFLHPASTPIKGKSYITLALISCQKLFLFLGDLSRYKEQANDSSNYGLARQWYIKAHQMNPKNGRPYNQLAILAIYARRKLDAVYYYMRSLMASIPVMSSRENLLSLFDENRKKYESTEKKRQMEREAKEKERMKEKEVGSNHGRLRREVWIHPGGGKRVHRTTSTAQSYDKHSEEDELSTISNLEVNKRFGMSFLHVQGKLFTKIGMETFQEAAIQMLREFRTLLQHSPIPLNSNRLLQLLALNMFAIDNTQLKKCKVVGGRFILEVLGWGGVSQQLYKAMQQRFSPMTHVKTLGGFHSHSKSPFIYIDDQLEPGYRSAVQECALVVSLQMFNLIVERCVQLLKEQSSEPQQNNRLIVNADVQVLLPAIKIWCDWLLCHSSVWNPPPSCRDYRVGQPGDAWSRLAALVNALEKLYHKQDLLSSIRHEGYELVRLPEDSTLGGFLPLMSNAQEPAYASKDTDIELGYICLRINKILFFGTVFLCGVDPPVLKLHKNETGQSEYISVVEIPSPPVQSDGEVCIESFSSDSGQESEDSSHTVGTEDSSSATQTGSAVVPEIQSLLHRKEQLERSQRKQERRQQQVQTILQQNLVYVEMEVKPHYLVADTNCFIDYLPQLQMIAQATLAQNHLYTLMVPLVVLNELDGLTRGQRDALTRPEHAVMVSEAAKSALEFLRSRNNIHPPLAIRCVTTKGTILKSTTFTVEQDGDEDMKNDDRILATCLNLCAARSQSSTNKSEQAVEGQPRKIYRDVVLLTEDRNLRVKALARDMPVREVPNFIQWAGLGLGVGLG